MGIRTYPYVWFDGETVPEETARVPLMTHALHYGTSVIDGIRVYEADNNRLFVFRLHDHLKRLRESAEFYSIKVAYAIEELAVATLDLLRRNEPNASCYVRPLVFVGSFGIDLGVNHDSPSHTAMILLSFSGYLPTQGLNACVSSWRRISDQSMPPMAKATGNYLNSVLATQECRRGGYDVAVLLDKDGFVSEAPGENIFLVKDSALLTPPLANSVLEGVTRNTVIQIARQLGYPVAERAIGRSELYTCDELFLTGTACEVASVVTIDDKTIGNAGEGPISRQIRETYRDIVTGKIDQYKNWLTPVS